MVRKLITEASLKEWYAKFGVTADEKAIYDDIIAKQPYMQKYIGRIVKWHKVDREKLKDIIDNLIKFDENIKNIADRDIYSKKYEFLDAVKEVIENLPKWFDRLNIPKEFEKILARHPKDAFKLTETADYFVFYIGSYDASTDLCYYPRLYTDYLLSIHTPSTNNGWCIGQPNTRGFFDGQRGSDGLYFLVQYKTTFKKSCIYILHSDGSFRRHNVHNYPGSGFPDEQEPGIMKMAFDDERIVKIFAEQKRYAYRMIIDFISWKVIGGMEIKSDFDVLLNVLNDKYQLGLTDEQKAKLKDFNATLNSGAWTSSRNIINRISAHPKIERYFLWMSAGYGDYTLDKPVMAYFEMIYKCKNLTNDMKQQLTNRPAGHIKLNQDITYDDLIASPETQIPVDNLKDFYSFVLPYIDKSDKTNLPKAVLLYNKLIGEGRRDKFIDDSGRFMVRGLNVDLLISLFEAVLENPRILFKTWAKETTPNNDYENIILEIIRKDLFRGKPLTPEVIKALDISMIDSMKEKLGTVFSSTSMINDALYFFCLFPQTSDNYKIFSHIARNYHDVPYEDMRDLLNVLTPQQIKEFNYCLDPDHFGYTYDKDMMRRIYVIFGAEQKEFPTDVTRRLMQAGLTKSNGSCFAIACKEILGMTTTASSVLNTTLNNSPMEYITVNTYKRAKVVAEKIVGSLSLIPGTISFRFSSNCSFFNIDNVLALKEQELANAIIYSSGIPGESVYLMPFLREFSPEFIATLIDLQNNSLDIEDYYVALEVFLNLKKILVEEEKILKFLGTINRLDSSLLLASTVEELEQAKLFVGIAMSFPDVETKKTLLKAIAGAEKELLFAFKVHSLILTKEVIDLFLSKKEELIKAYNNNFIFNCEYSGDKAKQKISRFFMPMINTYLHNFWTNYYNPEYINALNNFDFEKTYPILMSICGGSIRNSSCPLISAFVPGTGTLVGTLEKNLKKYEEFVLTQAEKLNVLIKNSKFSGILLTSGDRNTYRVIKYADWIITYSDTTVINTVLYYIMYSTQSSIDDTINLLATAGIKHQGYAVHHTIRPYLDNIELIKGLDSFLPEIFKEFSFSYDSDTEKSSMFAQLLRTKTAPEIIEIIKEKGAVEKAVRESAQKSYNEAIKETLKGNVIFKETNENLYVYRLATSNNLIFKKHAGSLPDISQEYFSFMIVNKENEIENCHYQMGSDLRLKQTSNTACSVSGDLKTSFIEWAQTPEGFSIVLATPIRSDVFMAVYGNNNELVMEKMLALELYVSVSFDDCMSIFQLIRGQKVVDDELMNYLMEKADVKQTYRKATDGLPNKAFYVDCAVICCIARNDASTNIDDVKTALSPRTDFDAIAMKVFDVPEITNAVIDGLHLDDDHKAMLRKMRANF
jgi:hypothetical protein